MADNTVPIHGWFNSQGLAGVSIYTWTEGQFQIQDGNAGGSFANDIQFSAPARVVDGGGELLGLKTKVNLSSGRFSGSFLHPVTGRKTSYAGALFQFEDAGGGHFLGTDQAGTVRLVGNVTALP